MRPRPALYAAALVAACASPTPRTQVMVELDVDDALRPSVASVEVVVFGGPAAEDPRLYPRRYGATLRPADLPRRIALVPLEDDRRGWRIEAVARDDGGAPLSAARVAGGYAEERTVRLPVSIEAACQGVACPPEQACRGGECGDLAVDVDALPDYPEP
ncbi:MAG: hypothetical protein ACFCGT_02265 [Sandaracinaceae bacterium]